MNEIMNSTNSLNPSLARSPRTDDDDDEISLLDLAAILWKRKWLVVGITAIAAVGAVLFSVGSLLLPPEKSYLPNVYTPKATMLISSGSSSNLSSLLSSSGLGGLASLAGLSTGGNSNQQLAVALATANTTIDQLNAKFDFASHYKLKQRKSTLIRKEVIKKLTAKIDDKSGLFTVSFTDHDPVYAKSVVDETVAILAARFAQLGGSKALEQKALLEKRLADVEAAIKDLEVRSKAFTAKYGVVQVEALATEQITILARLRSELILKEMEIENYRKIARVNDPVLDQLNYERQGLLDKIKEIETGSGTGSKVMPSQRELPGIAFEYARLQRDLAVQTELFKILTQQYELAKFNAAGQEPIFQIIEMAEVPDMKSGPSRALICIIAAFAGLFLAVLAVLIAESIDNVRHDPEAIARFKALSRRS